MSVVGILYSKPHNDLGNHDLFQISPYNRNLQKVKRQLFGPFDHEADKSFVRQELEKHCTFQSERWNFDFKNERPLNPNGLYDWRPATPIKNTKPLKRRPSEDVEFDNHELYCLPEDILTCSHSVSMMNEELTPPKSNDKTQRLITDFMPIKKNSSVQPSSKLMVRPNKVPRMSELKS
ncbi:hypothetical protein WA026_016229 [Henosepilachna vigintioctopunctata]|uniref:Cyclin-dependent kinase inhibitor domain-containing protein n=1 Tax=Henosepilachna vigintioctopunctata TaxID=420089 RepID=A0AAW1TWV3_9CUCU